MRGSLIGVSDGKQDLRQADLADLAVKQVHGYKPMRFSGPSEEQVDDSGIVDRSRSGCGPADATNHHDRKADVGQTHLNL